MRSSLTNFATQLDPRYATGTIRDYHADRILPRPLELLTVDSNEKIIVQVHSAAANCVRQLTVCPTMQSDALNFIRTLNKPLHIISVAGAPANHTLHAVISPAGVAREGKSAFLSLYMRLAQGSPHHAARTILSDSLQRTPRLLTVYAASK